MAVGGRRNNGDHEQPERDQEHRRSSQPALHSDPPLRRKRPFTRELPVSAAELSGPWPEIQRRLMVSLLGRPNVDHHTAEEVCHDVAERMLTRRATFESVEYFWNWLYRVTHNRMSNVQRKDAKVTAAEVPEAGTRDVASLVESRFVLEATVEAFRELKETDRRVLTAALNNEDRGGTKRDRDRVALQLSRARVRLARGTKVRLVGLPWWRRRWSTDPVPLGMASQAAMGAVAVTVGVLSTLLAPPHMDERPVVERITATASAEHRPYVVVPTADTAQAPDVAGAAAAPPTGNPEGAEPSDRGPKEHRIVVDPPADAPGRTEIETDPRRPKEDSLFCWENFPHVEDACVDHPLRRDGEWITPSL
jgi:Sigma-70 region 2